MSYKILDYIESTGSQYIDTGFYANPHCSIEVHFQISQLTTNWDTIFGARNASYSRYTARFENNENGLLGLQYSNSGTGKTTNFTTGYGKADFTDRFHIVNFEKNNAYIDGELVKTFNNPSDKTSYPYSLFLFANNNAGVPGDYAFIKISRCKIWNDGKLVRDFVPVMDEANEAGFLEKVTNTIYYSHGENSFVAGPAITQRKHLIRSNSTLYTVADGALSALTETEVTASLFQTYGVDEIPDGALLAGLTDPEVLYWQDSDGELPTLTITVKGTPPLPQMFTSEAMDLTHESIAGISHAAVDASEDVRFAISFDGGTTWKAFDGSAWFDVSDTAPGMLASTMNAITAEQWAEVVQLTAYRLRFWLPNVTAYVKSVVMHYINP